MPEFLAPALDSQCAIFNLTHSVSPPFTVYPFEFVGYFLEPFIQREHKVYTDEDREPEIPDQSCYNFHYA